MTDMRRKKQEDTTTSFLDNKSAITMTRNLVFYSRTKHIHLKIISFMKQFRKERSIWSSANKRSIRLIVTT
jgi:hypothetical protein